MTLRLNIAERAWGWLGMPVALALGLLLTGCASTCVQRYSRPFDFTQDTFAYRNDLQWEYVFDDAANKTSHRARDPKPDYTHHCFVVARSARQFFQHARFVPELPRATDDVYRKLIRKVAGRDPMRCTPENERVIIPGYVGLREFSSDKPKLLQEECGGAWHSYFQRGHWRMTYPFTRGHQEREARRLLESLRQNRPPVVHIVKFPQLTINHALLLFGATEKADSIEFSAYDPYEPNKPAILKFDRSTRSFMFPRNPYFIGGPVNIYEVYRKWDY